MRFLSCGTLPQPHIFFDLMVDFWTWRRSLNLFDNSRSQWRLSEEMMLGKFGNFGREEEYLGFWFLVQWNFDHWKISTEEVTREFGTFHAHRERFGNFVEIPAILWNLRLGLGLGPILGVHKARTDTQSV